MRRRAFIALLGGAAALRPIAVRAQSAMPVIGILTGMTVSPQAMEPIRKGLSEQGFVEGRNVTIEYRASANPARLPSLAAELVAARVAVILAGGGIAPAVAAKSATSTIPIVFANGGDPVKVGLVKSLNRPEGNVTGISFMINALGAKRLEMLREFVPNAKRVGLLVNPRNPSAETDTRDMEAAARKIGLDLQVVKASTDAQIDEAFAALAAGHADALAVSADFFFSDRSERLSTLAARHALPTIYSLRSFVDAGGLISYGSDVIDGNRQAAVYVGRILKGEKPGDLPVLQPTRFELVINTKTAKALGLTVPPTLLVQATDMVE